MDKRKKKKVSAKVTKSKFYYLTFIPLFENISEGANKFFVVDGGWYTAHGNMAFFAKQKYTDVLTSLPSVLYSSTLA